MAPEEVKLTFAGDVEQLCGEMSKEIAERRGAPAVLVVSIPQKTQVGKGTPGCLKTFRKLVRLSPYPVVCSIDTEALQPLDVVVALTCDLVKCTMGRVALNFEASDSLLPAARRHWQFFTGEQIGDRAVLDFGSLNFGSTEGAGQKLWDFLPHYWMAFRNVGMAAGIFMPGLVEGETVESAELPLVKPGEPAQRLKGIFNFYFGPKIASIFAAGDVLNRRATPASITQRVEEYAAQRAAAEADEARMQRALEGVAKCIRTTADTVEVTLTSDILYADMGEVSKLLAVVNDTEVKTIFFRLEDGVLTDAGSILPRENQEHILIYKWHRKWEQLLGLVQKKKVVCTVAGSQICPPLLELFFAAQERVWASPSRHLLWCKVPFAYSPGPEALQGGLRGLPIGSLRRLLTTGMTVEEAMDLKLMKLAAPGPKRAIVPLQPASAMVGKVERECRPTARKMRTVDFEAKGPDMNSWLWGGGRLDLPPHAGSKLAAKKGSCSLIGYGLAVPEEYKATQAEIATMLGVTKQDKRDWSILTASHIKTRYLAELEEDLKEPEKITMKHNRDKHLRWATKLLREAIQKACDDAGISPSQVGHVTVANSTGYLLPGLTAYVVKDESLGIPQTVCREDVIGMGCHAGLNSLKSAASWACANPGKYAISCGVEVSSAQYVWGKDTRRQLNTVIVNSLFGDGCFCSVLRTAPEGEARPPPAYFDMPPSWWMQLCDTDALDDMIYQVEETEDKYRFDLSELAPYHVGQGLFTLMQHAMREEIPVHHAQHVVTHTGGKTVLDCSAVALGLEGVPSQSLPYTIQALRDYGNQSSVSILFAFHNLVKSGDVRAGDNGLLVTMGPGAGLEMAMFTAGAPFPPRHPQRALFAQQSVLLSLQDLIPDSDHDFQDEDWIYSEGTEELTEKPAARSSAEAAPGSAGNLWRRILLGMKVCG